MGHPAVATHHRVLVTAEGRQPVLDEMAQGGQRFCSGRGEEPRPVRPDELDAVGRQPIEVSPHLLVDLVLVGPPGVRYAQGRGLGRRRAVVGVVVPLAGDRPVALHQELQPAAGVAVEVLQQQPLATSTVGPGGEVGARGGEAPSREPFEIAVRHQRLDQAQGGPGGRLHHIERLVHPRQTGAVGVGPPIVALLAELRRAMSHRRQDQLGLLPVKGPPPEDPGRLDHQHRLPGIVEEVWA